MVAVAVANAAVEMEASVAVRGIVVATAMVSMVAVVGVVVVVAILGGGGCSSANVWQQWQN